MNTWVRMWAGATLLLGVTPGCAGPVEATIRVESPDPVPTPVKDTSTTDQAPSPADSDGDGIVGAADRCPEQPETKNGFEDDDGCADVVPPAYLHADEVRFSGPLSFAVTGGLDDASKRTVEAIAELLVKEKSVELVEVGVGVSGKKGDKFATLQRAQRVVDALTKAGVQKPRLRPAGYGACGGEGTAAVVRFAVVRTGGADTKATLGCSK